MRPSSISALIALVIASGCAPRANGPQTLSPAEQQKESSAKAERQSQINRALDQLNSPDPAVRLTSMEQYAASSDADLRLMALTTAFTSSDTILRAAALAAAIGNSEALVVEITASRNKDSNNISQKTGGRFQIFVTKYDSNKRSFETITPYNSYEYHSNVKYFNSYPAIISADRLKMEFDIRQDFGTICDIVATLDKQGSKMTGTMSCKNRESYLISIDLIR